MRITKEILERECALLEAEPIVGEHTRADDLAACNPNFRPGKNGGWENNCQRCVLTYAMRRRGIDVTARPAIRGKDYIADTPLPLGSKRKCWTSALRRPHIIVCPAHIGIARNWEDSTHIHCIGNPDALPSIMFILQKMPEGAICAIRVIYADFGHMFIAERVNSRTVFFDPQQYGTPTQLNAESNLQNIRSYGAFICRLDNLDITPKMTECCQPRSKSKIRRKNVWK